MSGLAVVSLPGQMNEDFLSVIFLVDIGARDMARVRQVRISVLLRGTTPLERWLYSYAGTFINTSRTKTLWLNARSSRLSPLGSHRVVWALDQRPARVNGFWLSSPKTTARRASSPSSSECSGTTRQSPLRTSESRALRLYALHPYLGHQR